MSILMMGGGTERPNVGSYWSGKGLGSGLLSWWALHLFFGGNTPIAS